MLHNDLISVKVFICCKIISIMISINLSYIKVYSFLHYILTISIMISAMLHCTIITIMIFNILSHKSITISATSC